MRALLNCIRSRPVSVRNLVETLLALGGEAQEDQVQRLYYVESPPESHWADNLDAAIGLGLVEAGNGLLRTTAEVSLGKDEFAGALRRSFRVAESANGHPSQVIYPAYRAVLTLPLSESGAVEQSHVLEAVLEAVGQAATFNETKYQGWREWMDAAGLGYSLGSAFAPVAAPAIRDFLRRQEPFQRMATSEFLELLETEIPMVPATVDTAEHVLGDGPSVALHVLETRGTIALHFEDDALSQWTLALPHQPVTHITLRRVAL